MSDQTLKIYTLGCEELTEYLKQNGFSSEVCQVIKGQLSGFHISILNKLLMYM